MSERPRILVSNDDGYQSEGIRALAAAMEELGEVWVVAPEVEQSASSHAISIHRPLRLREVRPRWYAVDGTPTDCAWLGIHHVLRDRRPRILVSGINHGPNLADDVTYSGTLAAAMEASIIGVPAIAFSLAGWGVCDFGPAARFARALVAAALARDLPAEPPPERQRAPRTSSPTATSSPASASTRTALTSSRRRTRGAARTSGSAGTSTSTRTSPAATATSCFGRGGSR